MREQNANLRPGRFSAQRFSRLSGYFQIRQVTNKWKFNSELRIKHSALLAAVPAASAILP